LLTFGLAIYQIVMKKKEYIVVASESLDKAELFVTRLRDELEYNIHLIEDHYPSGYKTTDWAKGVFITKTRVRVQAIGYGMSGRGLIWGSTRPDQVYYDDLETTENAGDQAMKDKFLSDLYPAIARNNPDAKRTYVGTIINKDSLLFETIQDTDLWTSIKYEAKKDDGEMLAHMLYSKADYEQDYKSYKRKGKLSIFFAENHNNPLVQDDEAVFKTESFRYIDDTTPDGEEKVKSFTNHHILYDPAMPPSGRTRRKNVDRSAIIVLSTNSKKEWYVREIHANRDTPSKNRDLLFRLSEKYQKPPIFMETIAAQRGMYLEIIEDSKRRGKKINIREIPSHVGSKEARIELLQPIYYDNLIYHNKNDKNTHILEEELLLFGNTNHDDVSDCLSFGIGRVKYPSSKSPIASRKQRDAYENFFENQSDLSSWRVL
jgi:predicted phage terminase large subunit-like protein